LAARIEKSETPTVAEVCAAAGRAVIGLLSDPRAGDGGPWVEPLASWQDAGRIRKLVRRGRASAWQRAQEPEGFTASVGRAEVRAYVPCPMDRVPQAVARLQIRSTELDEPCRLSAVPRLTEGMLIAVTPLVEMSWGKQAAQCAHAAQLLWMRSDPVRRADWSDRNRPIAVVHPDPALWEDLVGAGVVNVRDGGFTEIPAGTMTAVANWLP